MGFEVNLAISRFDTLDRDIATLNRFMSINEKEFMLQASTKTVFDGTDVVYKVYPLGEGYSRYLFGKFINELIGTQLFLPCDILKIYYSFNTMIVREPKIEVIETLEESYLLKYLNERNIDTSFLKKYGIKFYEKRNSGWLNGELKLFDGVWNVYVVIRKDLGVVRLQDSQGNVIVEEKLHEWHN